jgi:hypothetical protein
MRRQSNELKNRINHVGLYCVWTRCERTPGAPLTARWLCDGARPSNRDNGSNPTRKREDTCSGITLQFV